MDLLELLEDMEMAEMADQADALDVTQDAALNPPGRQRQPPVFNRRVDPTEVLSDVEFKSHFRFAKESVRRLVQLLEGDLVPEGRRSNRGRPLTPLQKVCIALNHFAGALFQRVAAHCGGVSKTAAHYAIRQVTDALVNRRKEFIRYHSRASMRHTAVRMEEQFGLPRFAFAVDGVFIKFDGAPRSVPPNTQKQDYWGRKSGHCVNALVVGNDEKLILDLDVDWPGKAHDAAIWKLSRAKKVLETQLNEEFLMAGDGAFPISPTLMKPFTNTEAGEMGLRRRFNAKLSGLRSVM